MPETTEVPSASLRRELTDHLMNATRGNHLTVMHYRRPIAVIVDPAWYAQALRAMTVCDALAPREESAE